VSGRGGIGLFGGSFNPIHLGHLRAAEEVREAEQLDEVRFVPAALPPHKEVASLVTASHRLRMVELAVAGVPGFRVSTVELERGGVSYSVDTLRAVRTEVGDAARIVFVVGYDAFRDFHTWKEHAAIFGLCDVVVVTRPPAPATLAREEIPLAARETFWYDSDSEVFRHPSGHVLKLQRITALDISAASIRTRLAGGRSIRFLVPPSVAEYIVAHRLYRQEEPPR
jgi:nicotinate-nucleotide adenylyltransferase